MSVRVTPTVQSGDACDFTHVYATKFSTIGTDSGILLRLVDAKGEIVAEYAPGCWAYVEVLPEPESEPLAAARDRARRATEQVLIHEGWTPPGGFDAVASAPITAAADRWSQAAADSIADYPEAAKCPSVTMADETTTTTEAVLSETSEPYVSVSVSANDADELTKLLRKLIRTKGAKSFGLAEG